MLEGCQGLEGQSPEAWGDLQTQFLRQVVEAVFVSDLRYLGMVRLGHCARLSYISQNVELEEWFTDCRRDKQSRGYARAATLLGRFGTMSVDRRRDLGV